MGTILLEGMEFFAFHGCFKEEQIIGTKFIVDIQIEVAGRKNSEVLSPVPNHLGEAALNLLTLGAHDRVKKSMDGHRRTFSEYKEWHKKHENSERETRLVLLQLVNQKRSAFTSLSNIKDVLPVMEFVDGDDTGLRSGDIINIRRIKETLTAGEVALGGVAGTGAGITSAFTSWSLVGTLGAASTGTPIIALAGAAKVSAILAWLGGGSLAAGGAGMAGGAVALLGIAFIPALVVSGGLQHFLANRKINEIEKEAAEATETVLKIKDNLPRLAEMRDRAQKMLLEVEKARDEFVTEYNYYRLTTKQRWALVILKVEPLVNSMKNPFYYFSRMLEQQRRKQLIASANRLAKIIQTPVVSTSAA